MSTKLGSAGGGSSAGLGRPKVNLRSTAVKRIMQEANELSDPTEQDFVAAPLETDIFEWHCTMRGVPGSEFEGGLYHLRILLPPSYPMSAPDIILLTPNGRFELGKKICIDGLTSFHAGSWQPAWGVRTAILGLRSFWMQGGEALSAIGALDCSKEERKRLAKLSRDWVCPTCDCRNCELIPDAPTSAGGSSTIPTVSEPVVAPSDDEAILAEVDGVRAAVSVAARQVDTTRPPERRSEAGGSSEAASGSSMLSAGPLMPPGTTEVLAAPSTGPIAGIPAPSTPVSTSPASSQPPEHLSVVQPTAEPIPPPTRTIPIPHPIPVPIPTSAPSPTLPLPLSQSRRGVPLWLDALIFACLSMLVLMIARKAVLGGGRDEAGLGFRDDL